MTPAPSTDHDSPPVTQGDLWRQFLPLSLTDVTMAFGDPLLTVTLAHLPDTKANLAAVGVAKALAVLFESPIIMVLHASNALAGSTASRRALWRFVLLAVGLLTALLLLMVLPPVFGWVAMSILGVPAELVDRSRLVLTLMVLWPAAIGWRRYFQGLLIHAGNAGAVGRASVARLVLVAAILGIGFWQGVSGMVLAGVALVAGVILEAALVTVAAVRSGATAAPVPDSTPDLPATVSGVWRFYWPLANSMLVVWGGRALLVALVARAVDGPVALAAWPAAWGMVLLIANATRMVQQVIIRHRTTVPQAELLRFAGSVGMVCAALLFLTALTGIGHGVLAAFVGPHPDLLAAVIPVVTWCIPVPLLVALQNATQGLMIGAGKTGRVNQATWLGTALLLVVTWSLMRAGVAGATAAAVAMVSALALETVWLAGGVLGQRAESAA